MIEQSSKLGNGVLLRYPQMAKNYSGVWRDIKDETAVRRYYQEMLIDNFKYAFPEIDEKVAPYDTPELILKISAFASKSDANRLAADLFFLNNPKYAPADSSLYKTARKRLHDAIEHVYAEQPHMAAFFLDCVLGALKDRHVLRGQLMQTFSPLEQVQALPIKFKVADAIRRKKQEYQARLIREAPLASKKLQNKIQSDLYLVTYTIIEDAQRDDAKYEFDRNVVRSPEYAPVFNWIFFQDSASEKYKNAINAIKDLIKEKYLQERELDKTGRHIDLGSTFAECVVNYIKNYPGSIHSPYKNTKSDLMQEITEYANRQSLGLDG